MVLGVNATFRTGQLWCSPAHSGRWTIFNARRLRIVTCCSSSSSRHQGISLVGTDCTYVPKYVGALWTVLLRTSNLNLSSSYLVVTLTAFWWPKPKMALGLRELIDQKTGKYRLSSTCYSSPIPWNPTNYRNLWISEQGTFNVQENCEL